MKTNIFDNKISRISTLSTHTFTYKHASEHTSVLKLIAAVTGNTYYLYSVRVFHVYNADYRIAPNIRGTLHVFLVNFVSRHPIEKIFRPKIRMVCIGRGFIGATTIIFSTKINTLVILNVVLKKSFGHKNLEHYTSIPSGTGDSLRGQKPPHVENLVTHTSTMKYIVCMEILAGIKHGNLAPNQAFKKTVVAEFLFGGWPNLTCKARQVLNIGGT